MDDSRDEMKTINALTRSYPRDIVTIVIHTCLSLCTKRLGAYQYVNNQQCKFLLFVISACGGLRTEQAWSILGKGVTGLQLIGSSAVQQLLADDCQTLT